MVSMTSIMPAYLLPGVPVYQPSHLEGDSSLATEILPGPPPLASVAQNPLLTKRDPRKDSGVYSYLPASDPGTTYSGVMHGTWNGQESRSNKRAKMDKGAASGRAQRASARNQNGSMNAMDLVSSEGASGSQPAPSLGSDAEIIIMDDDPMSLLMPDSSQNIVDQSSHGTNTRAKRKDKGKGREVENFVRIKEEPQTVNLRSPEPQTDNLLNNNDHCSACRSQGALVYCDGCPRAFHLWCLDPPMDSVDEGDSRWFCPACTLSKHPPRKPPPGLLAPLIQALDSSIPTEYQLPDDVRNFFKDVGTSARGGYVNTSEIKPPRLNRLGQLEDRDAHRLRDRNGQPVLCFRCGTSALPDSTAAAAPSAKRARRATARAEQYEMWKNIISCDYCDLHWHLDCLDPPLSTMPSFSKKWMCPNHSEQIIACIPFSEFEISNSGQYNNGNIEIIETQSIRPINFHPKVTVDEVLINGRRYRVPERIILLDFWNKISKNVKSGTQHIDSPPSSPLTSLSSLDEEDFSQPPPPASSATDMLWDFKRGSNSSGSSSHVNGLNPGSIHEYRRIDSLPSSSQTTPKPARASKSSAKKTAAKAPTSTGAPDPSVTSIPPIESLSITPSTLRRRKTDATDTRARPDSNTRALRSRSKVVERSRSGGEDVESSITIHPAAASSYKTNRVRVKVEESDNTPFLFDDGSLDQISFPVVSPPVSKPAVKKRPARKKPTMDGDTNGVSVKQENDPHVPPPKRGRKRKDRDDEAPYIDRSKHKTKGKREVKPRASKSAPSTASVSSLSTILSSTPAASGASAPATPSLKIRLPPSRMTTLGSPIKAVATTSSARSS
ncbi:hypothetical protein D9757_001651 [Collybiopsis confluens]|uniref:PHD-type domain-containing protein n=1 Tax=Collybiopsis confluens TaxID=2823264 RepID=A0A8H5HY92_9AGAR|nr:hypothetical protein D9757_001651 [Collybiopsis confluens]